MSRTRRHGVARYQSPMRGRSKHSRNSGGWSRAEGTGPTSTGRRSRATWASAPWPRPALRSMVDVVHTPAGKPPAEDTRAAIRKFLAAGVDLIVSCGGGAIARNICDIAGQATSPANSGAPPSKSGPRRGKWRRNDRRHAARRPSESKRSSFLREINARWSYCPPVAGIRLDRRPGPDVLENLAPGGREVS